MLLTQVEKVLKDSTYTGYPVVVSHESQYLVGYVLRRDIQIAIATQKKNPRVTERSMVYFNKMLQNNPSSSDEPAPIRLYKLLDLVSVVEDSLPVFILNHVCLIFVYVFVKSPVTITDQTPMETVMDMFRKLGLRICLVTHNGYF